MDAPEALGAIGDICYSVRERQVDEELMVIAGDTYFDFPLSGFMDACRESGQDGVCVQKVEDRRLLTRLGVVQLDEDRNIVSIEEKPPEPKSDMAMYAIYCYTPETLRLLDRYRREGNPMDAPGYFVVWLYTRKPITAYAIEGSCHDVGTIEAYTALCESKGIVYPSLVLDLDGDGGAFS
jgi:glucose-1-phosphate thymidylyltransferase